MLKTGWSHAWRATRRPRRRLPPFKLALQGGGAHGAFTWGVLDRLLEEADFRFAAVSGTSAGAMNAVALASGWLDGGADGARAALARLWGAVADLARLAPVRPAVVPQVALDLPAQLLSPYQLNPLGLNPLRDVLERQIDFDALREAARLDVIIAATDVETGAARLFSGSALSVDAVLASACLPQVFQAVEIDGRSYWDGGYASNPPLLCLAGTPGPADLLLVQINPLARTGTPRSATEIRNRIGEICFGRPLSAELQELAGSATDSWLRRTLEFRPRMRRLARHRLHHIDGSTELGQLQASTKVGADAPNVGDLRQRGRCAADLWLAAFRGAPAPRARAEDHPLPARSAA